MRVNKFGIRGLKCVTVKGHLTYFWTPPVSLQKLHIFKHKTLGTNYDAAAARALNLNAELEVYRLTRNGFKPALNNINLSTVGHLIRQFEASPRFAQYSLRTRQDYSWMYRAVECQIILGNGMFGELAVSEVTRQLAYAIYEQNVADHGHDFANKTMSACHAAFRYGTLRYCEIKSNPFADLDKLSSAPRRQRWTDEQLSLFVKKANELRNPSVGRCVLMCMELMQRPGDILSLQWDSYHEREKVWHIRQSKRGAIVRIPEHVDCELLSIRLDVR